MNRTTPLHEWNRANGAKFSDFAGWRMPIRYESGSIREHHLVRRSAGLFDVSHMGQILVRGEGAEVFLDRLVSSDLSSLQENQSMYGLLCREDGGILDDVFVYRLPREWLVVVNAANAAKDIGWFHTNQPDSSVEIVDASDQFAMFAFQGPAAIGLMNALCTSKTGTAESGHGVVGRLPRFSAAQVTISGVACTIGRTGYTGEDGVEIFAPAEHAVAVWEAILWQAHEQGVECGPVGLAARDSLRFEPGFALYGHEISEQISPIQARLKWACNLNKEFIGAAEIRRQVAEGVSIRLATAKLAEPGVPRQGFTVLYQGSEVGYVTSGLYAPTIDAYCANLFIDSAVAKLGTQLEIKIREKEKRAVVVKRPLYTPAYR